MKASIIIRTYNEARHLPDLLKGIRSQVSPGVESEVVVVDSGSTDQTLDIAKHYDCNIEHIRKEDFSFGRSLNLGCASASGDALVIVSGHCIPANDNWLANIVAPLADGRVVLVYGRQIGNGTSRFSECRIFEKYFPPASQVPQEGFFCNNANSAILRSVWQQNPFDESLTGLEDMHFAKQLTSKGMAIGYVADAVVQHLHDETWSRIKNRFEREAIALQYIMPEVHLSFSDFLRYTCTSIFHDCGEAIQSGQFIKYAPEIVMYRISQYWGSYRGNHYHRKISRQRKERYFYPR
ncbi:Glycosyl transferase family 2 [Georgfuchsia toluolica]|uniref:Glycosyl transferase family 2 n=1 Tax=Georgfuchsia toluolica TaxID=424218 RepID=A0A916J465_9PROT|nr:glycosyltransferase [Georgfuchsia toluolica]CAG4884359.1 Glycosyl transferase family 2 [Georgfuchsia toluolica]